MRHPHREPHILKGYAYPKGNLVYAECIDLSIMVARPTLEEAIQALDDAIRGTLEVAAEQGILEDILERKSPWANRVRYYLAVARTWLRPWRPGGTVGIRPQPLNCRASCPTHA